MRWSTRRVLLAAGLIAALISGTALAEVRLVSAKSSYLPGEEVVISIVNDTEDSIWIGTPCAIRVENREDELVWEPLPSCTPLYAPEITAFSSFQFSWNQMDMGNGMEGECDFEEPFRPCAGDYIDAVQVADGCYQARTFWFREDDTVGEVSTVFGINQTCFRFAVLADSRDFGTSPWGANEDVFPPVLRSLAQTLPAPDFILFGGDLVTGRTDGPDVVDQLNQWIDLATPSFPESRFYPAFGGHERNRPGTSHPYVWSAFTEVFDPVANGAMDGPCEYFNPANYGHTVYFCDHGNARFFVLNNDIVNKACDVTTATTQQQSCDPFAHEWGQGRPANNDGPMDQVAWLASKLGVKPLNFIVEHEPVFGVFRYLDPVTRDGFARVLGNPDNNLTMVFTGHEHQYSRRLINVGLTECERQFDGGGAFLGFDPACDFNHDYYEVKTGTCGAPIYDEPEEYPVEGLRNLVVGPGFRYHYAIVDVEGERSTMRVYAVDGDPASPTLIDRFTVPAGTPPPLPIQPRMATAAEMSAGEKWRLWDGSNDVCRYFPGRGEPPADWTSVDFDDSKWFVGPIGFGYGDGDDSTRLFDMQGAYISVYARCSFSVNEPEAVRALTFEIDYDDGFIAFLNGNVIASANLVGSSPPYDMAATAFQEAQVYQGMSAERFDLSATLLQAGSNVLAIQGHNHDQPSSDFTLLPWLGACEQSATYEASCTDGLDDDCDGMIDGDDSECGPLLVQLDGFTAEVTAGGALLRWQTVSEIDNVGFHVLRASPGREPRRLTQGLIPARGGALGGAAYSYLDRSRLGDGPVEYFIEDWDVRGVATLHGPVVLDRGAPGRQRTWR